MIYYAFIYKPHTHTPTQRERDRANRNVYASVNWDIAVSSSVTNEP